MLLIFLGGMLAGFVMGFAVTDWYHKFGKYYKE